jgi:hypothetical protein
MKIRNAFDEKLDEFIALNELVPGNVPVTISRFLEVFNTYVGETLPVTKSMLGMALSNRFFKKQSRQTLEQQYFLNKSI